MVKDVGLFLLKLMVFCSLLCGIHYYIFTNFFSGIILYLPIWSIYLFNLILVLIVYALIKYILAKDISKVYNTFLISIIIKMVLAIVFLLPLFFGKSDNNKVEVINFFAVYFLFLAFEVFTITRLIAKETE